MGQRRAHGFSGGIRRAEPSRESRKNPSATRRSISDANPCQELVFSKPHLFSRGTAWRRSAGADRARAIAGTMPPDSRHAIISLRFAEMRMLLPLIVRARHAVPLLRGKWRRFLSMLRSEFHFTFAPYLCRNRGTGPAVEKTEDRPIACNSQQYKHL